MASYPSVSFASETRLVAGKSAAVAINNKGKIVYIYRPAKYSTRLVYILGTLQPSTMKVTWQAENVDLNVIEDDDDMHHARVALNDQLQVVVVWDRGLKTLRYRAGYITVNGIIQWGDIAEYGDNGQTPNVCLDNNGSIVEVEKYWSHQYVSSRLGKFVDGQCDFTSSSNVWTSTPYATEPSVGLNDSGQVVVGWANFPITLIKNNPLSTMAGRVNVAKELLDLGSRKEHDKGASPTMRLDNSGRIFTIHSGVTDKQVYYSTGWIQGEKMDLSDSKKLFKHSSIDCALSSTQGYVIISYGTDNLGYIVGRLAS